jgi:outer membrane protein assembly factor BamB
MRLGSIGLASLVGLVLLAGGTGAFRGNTVPSAVVNAAWTTFHLDNARSGNDTLEPGYNSAIPAWESPALDGKIYAEPLVLGSTVYVATMNNTVYALNAVTGAILWSNHLASPVPASAIPCSGDGPVVGIVSTPVIDPGAGRLYAVGLTNPGFFILYALDLNNSGNLVFSRDVDPPAPFQPLVQGQRPALSLANGLVYVPFGGHDCGTYHGYVVGARTDNTEAAPLVYVDQDPSMNGAPFWGASGAAIDAAGNLYAATGNGFSETVYDHGESVVRLSPDLIEQDHWAPAGWASWNQLDRDLGSMGPSLLNNGLLFQGSKTGDGYLLDTANLGGTGGAPMFSAHVCGALTDDAAFGGTAYADPYVFMPCKNGLYGLKLNGATFTTAWRYPATGPGIWAGPPIVAGGLVWTIDINAGFLIGVDPNTGSARFAQRVGSVTHFSTPSAGGGRIFVGVNSSPDFASPHVTAFLLNPPQTAASIHQRSSPFAVLNTISGAGGHPGKLGPGEAYTFKVRLGPVPGSASSALVQLFALNATAQTQLSLWTSPLANPLTPTLLLGPGQTRSNLVEIPFSGNGSATIYNSSGAVDVVAVLVGWNIPSSAASAGRFLPEPPYRVLDTQNGVGAPMAPIAPGETLTVPVLGVGPVPATGVSEVSLDLTAINGGSGTLTVWPAGASRPSMPSLAIAPGQTLTGHLQVQVGVSGAINVYNGSTGYVDATIDTEGSFTNAAAPSSTSGFVVGMLSQGLASSNPALQMQGALGPGQAVKIQVAGRSGVPATGAAAVLLNLTGAFAAAGGSLAVWAGDTPPSGTTELTYPATAGASNLLTVPISAAGTISIYNRGTAAVYIAASVQGWYTT